MLVKAPEKGPFIVSTKSEQELLSSFQWLAPLAIFGGVAISALGVWLGILHGWNPLFIVGLVGAGVVVGIFLKELKINTFIGG
jgi:hypothetical protein